MHCFKLIFKGFFLIFAFARFQLATLHYPTHCAIMKGCAYNTIILTIRLSHIHTKYLRSTRSTHFLNNILFVWNLVPAPRHLTLERQLNKSVLIGWNIPEPPGCHQIESYHVYVDGVLKVTVKANERTRALVEGVDSNRVRYIIAYLYT